jgi:lysophospholipase L1-like esterase
LSIIKEILRPFRDTVRNIYCGYNPLFIFGTGPNRGKIICAYGDSITYQAKWYRTVIKQHSLKKIINCGIPSATITGSNGLSSDEKLKAVMKNKSDAILIMAGANDFKYNCRLGTIASTSIDEFYGAYKALLDKIRKQFPAKRIILITPTFCMCKKDFPQTDGEINDLGLRIGDYAEAVKRIGDMYRLKVISINESLKWNKDNCMKYLRNEVEFLHPNKLGGRSMGKVIGDSLPEL